MQWGRQGVPAHDPHNAAALLYYAFHQGVACVSVATHWAKPITETKANVFSWSQTEKPLSSGHSVCFAFGFWGFFFEKLFSLFFSLLAFSLPPANSLHLLPSPWFSPFFCFVVQCSAFPCPQGCMLAVLCGGCFCIIPTSHCCTTCGLILSKAWLWKHQSSPISGWGLQQFSRDVILNPLFK